MNSTAQKVSLSWASPGQQVWIANQQKEAPELYKKARIVKIIDNENLSVKHNDNSSEAFSIKGDKVFPATNYELHPKGFDDMMDIEDLNEAELLNNIQLRFQQSQIFTYVGPTLITINPYKYLAELFEKGTLEKYQEAVSNTHGFELKDYQPHVYAISAAAIKNLMDNQRPQAIVISGESGAGKTETAKFAMKFLTTITKKLHDHNKEQHQSIEDQILACNPIMEAFGNAKTLRNDNSSRFGKYVSLLVEKNSTKIVGATITNYLLEKSRICAQSSEERNYHIFYALLRGQTEQELKKFFLTKNLMDYECLKNTFKGPIRGAPDTELFQDVVNSFQTMGFSNEEQQSVWSFVAATLLLNNINFDEGNKDDGQPCSFTNETEAKNLTKLLGLDFKSFADSLLYKTRTISGEVIQSTITKDECTVYRNSLAKELYNRLFNWLVKRLNYTVMPQHLKAKGKSPTKIKQEYDHIGLLDIFGFEILELNSLEQLFINYANEKLQQLYIEYIFKAEEKEFMNEGLKNYLSELNFKDNQHILDMLDKVNPPGIFQTIDELSSVNSTDTLLCDRLAKTYHKPNMPFGIPRMSRDSFIVKHTAKDVEYNIENFRAKNKDELPKVIEDNMKNSTVELVSKIWRNLCLDEDEAEAMSPSKLNPRDKFLGYKFRMQMKDLMEELQKCECHFIRCVKPNEVKEPGQFVPSLVLKQITYMGVLDTIRIRKEIYPVRRSFQSFYQRYIDLDPENSALTFQEHLTKASNFKDLSKKICQTWVPHLSSNLILFGNNKIFMKISASDELEKLRTELVNRKNLMASKIQKVWFKYIQLKKLRAALKGIVTIQKIFRTQGHYKQFKRLRSRTIQIQRHWRSVLTQRRLHNQTIAATMMQRWWKAKYLRMRFVKIMRSVKELNRYWRGAVARKKARGLKCAQYIIEEILNKGTRKLFIKVKKVAVIVIQRWVRGYLCRCKESREVQRIRNAKKYFVESRAAIIIQRNAKGYLTRRTVKRMRRAAFYIQGFVKMRWLSTIFLQLKAAAIIIQRAYRSWILKRNALNTRLREFLESETNIYETTKLMEQIVLFGSIRDKKCEKNEAPSQGFKIDKPTETFNSRLQQHTMFLNQVENNRTSANASLIMDTTMKLGTMLGGVEPLASPQFDQTLNNTALLNGLAEYSSLNKTKDITPYTAKKINVFVKIIDLELLMDMTDIYEPLWSIQALQLQKECMTNNEELQVFDVGQAHSIAVSNNNKVYSAGWNDCGQLGRSTYPHETACGYSQLSFPSSNFNPKQVASGDDHSLIIDYQGKLYSWGDNKKGQLGVGVCREITEMTTVDIPGHEPVKEIRAKGESNLILTQSGKAFYWPLHLGSGEIICKPTEVCLPPKIQAATIACGINFAAIVSKNGFVFTFGKDNQYGELGHGDNYPRDSPVLIESLKNEGAKIIDVACGYKHVICKNTLGKVYTWGWGEKGQLGHGSFQNEYSPRLVSLNAGPSSLVGTKTKAMQVHAGFKHSVVMMDNKKILWFGSNATIEDQSLPIEANLNLKIPNMNPDFHPLRVMCTWSKSLNVTYVTIADTRPVQMAPTLKQKVLTTLTSKIEENYATNNIDIPYVESISNYFSVRSMKNCAAKEKKGYQPYSPKAKKKILTKHPSIANSNAFLGQELRNRDLNETMTKSPFISRFEEETPFKTDKSFENQPNILTNFSHYDTFSARNQTKNLDTIPSPSFNERIEAAAIEMSNTQGEINTGNTEEAAYSSRQLETMSESLKDIKERVEEIQQIPKSQWTKADKEFMVIAMDPKVQILLQSLPK